MTAELPRGTKAYRLRDGTTALLRPYSPYLRRTDGLGPTISSYYIESNALYHQAKALAARTGGTVLSGDKVPVRSLLCDCGVAAIGRNGLAATALLGSCFCVQIVKDCGEFDFEEHDAPLFCENCGACQRACPGGAIGEEGLRTSRCIRAHMDGEAMPGFACAGVTRLFGCDVCQMACKRNAAVKRVTMDENEMAVFTYENIFSQSAKKEMAALVGKNMLTRGRIQAAALLLAARDNWSGLSDAVDRLRGDDRPSVISAIDYIQSKHMKQLQGVLTERT